MITLILKITHNTAAKDAIAVARGLYRVAEGAVARGAGTDVRRSSWMDHLPQGDHPVQEVPMREGLGSRDAERSRQQLTLVRGSALGVEKAAGSPSVNEPTREKLSQGDPIVGIKQQLLIKQQPPVPNSASIPQSPITKPYVKQLKNIHTTQSSTPGANPEVSTVPSSRLGRIFQFGRLGLSLASASFFAKDKSEEQYAELAERVSNQLCKMRGAPLKLAQMLSIQEDNLIPAPIRRAFQRARESAHVIPPQEVAYMLEKNLGSEWRSRFQHFTDTPFASASIGQVHRASLLDGRPAAVKVQYRGVRASINSDIDNLGLLLRIPGVFPRGMFVEKILANMKKELMQECDYQREKSFQQKYAQYLRRSLGDEARLYKVPGIYEDLSTAEVLTSEYLPGIKIKDLEQGQYPQQIKDQIGRRLMKLTFRQLFEMGIMQSDPNPSNFTFNPEADQLNLYDFGATHIYKPEFLRNYYDIIAGSAKGDRQQIWEASIRTGFVTGEENPTMRDSHIESILITGEPIRHEGLYDFGEQEITARIYKTIPLMLKNRLKSPPEEVYSLHRKLSGSYLACIRLGARVDCRRIFQEIEFDTMASKELPPIPSSQL